MLLPSHSSNFISFNFPLLYRITPSIIFYLLSVFCLFLLSMVHSYLIFLPFKALSSFSHSLFIFRFHSLKNWIQLLCASLNKLLRLFPDHLQTVSLIPDSLTSTGVGYVVYISFSQCIVSNWLNRADLSNNLSLSKYLNNLLQHFITSVFCTDLDIFTQLLYSLSKFDMFSCDQCQTQSTLHHSIVTLFYNK